MFVVNVTIAHMDRGLVVDHERRNNGTRRPQPIYSQSEQETTNLYHVLTIVGNSTIAHMDESGLVIVHERRNHGTTRPTDGLSSDGIYNHKYHAWNAKKIHSGAVFGLLCCLIMKFLSLVLLLAPFPVFGRLSDPNTAIVKGRIFTDTNGDSTQLDAFGNLEPPLTDKLLHLLDEDTRAVLRSTTTDSNGEYIFQNLPAGVYRVDFVPDDMVPVLPKVGASEINSDIDPLTGLGNEPLNVGQGDTTTFAAYDGGFRPPCVTSDANLVCNGSFEFNDVPDDGAMDISSAVVLGWKSLTGMVCLVDNRDGIAAPDGFNYAELDCIAGGPTEGLFQDIPTEAGQIYDLTFMMRARDPAKANTEDEGVNVSFFLVCFVLPYMYTFVYRLLFALCASSLCLVHHI